MIEYMIQRIQRIQRIKPALVSIRNAIFFTVGWLAVILYFVAFLSIPTALIILVVQTVRCMIGG